MEKFKLNKGLINDLQLGKLAIDNRGNPNLELLKAILNEAFPEDLDPINGYHNYYKKNNYRNKWFPWSSVTLPTIPLLDFLEKEETFPIDDFGVKVENGNGKEIIDYLVSKGFINANDYIGYGSNGIHYFIKTMSKNIDCKFINQHQNLIRFLN